MDQQENTPLSLRHLQPSDFDALWEYLSDPQVTRFLTWKHYTHKSTAQHYFAKAMAATNFPDEVLGVASDKTSQIIGSVHLIHRDAGATQFGFGIARKWWGQGLGRQVVASSLKYIHSHEVWSAFPIWADVHQQNSFAIAVLEQLGFTLFQTHIEPARNRYLYAG